MLRSSIAPEIARTRDAPPVLEPATGGMINELVERAPADARADTYNYEAFDFSMEPVELERWLQVGPRFEQEAPDFELRTFKEPHSDYTTFAATLYWSSARTSVRSSPTAFR